MTLTLAKWTLDEYHQMVESGVLDDRHVELLQGEIVEMSPEKHLHAYSSTSSGEYLTRLLGDLAIIRPAKPVTLPNNSEPEPDIAVVQRLGREYLEHHPYPENIFWLIEYANSSLDKDLNFKSQIYAEANIPEYWVVNLPEKHLVVFRQPQNGKYTTKLTLTSGTIYPISFPAIAISVDIIICR
jgi:Uma2 family endonuclease